MAINVSIKANQAVYGWLIKSLAPKQKNIGSRTDGPVANSISLLWLVMSEILAIICQSQADRHRKTGKTRHGQELGPEWQKAVHDKTFINFILISLVLETFLQKGGGPDGSNLLLIYFKEVLAKFLKYWFANTTKCEQIPLLGIQNNSARTNSPWENIFR